MKCVPKLPAEAFPFTGEYSPNLDLTNMISPYTKEFFMGKKKTPQIRQILKNFSFQIGHFFNDTFQ
jgi:hypothetical protein